MDWWKHSGIFRILPTDVVFQSRVSFTSFFFRQFGSTSTLFQCFGTYACMRLFCEHITSLVLLGMHACMRFFCEHISSLVLLGIHACMRFCEHINSLVPVGRRKKLTPKLLVDARYEEHGPSYVQRKCP